MYLHSEDDNDAENKDVKNDDEYWHDDMVEDDGLPELVSHDHHVMADVKSRIADEMYSAYRREP